MKFLIISVIIAVCLFESAFAFAFEINEGPWFPESVNDTLVAELAARGLKYENRGSSFYYYKLIAIKAAKFQPAKPFGANHQVTILIGRTNCSKLDPNASSCEVPPNAPLQLCTHNIYVSGDLYWRELDLACCVPAQESDRQMNSTAVNCLEE